MGRHSAVAQLPVSDAALLASGIGVPEQVVFRSFVSETVVLDLRSGSYHALDAVEGRWLEVLERSRDVRSAAAGLAAELGQPVERVQAELCAFCRRLAARGLLAVGAPRR